MKDVKPNSAAIGSPMNICRNYKQKNNWGITIRLPSYREAKPLNQIAGAVMSSNFRTRGFAILYRFPTIDNQTWIFPNTSRVCFIIYKNMRSIDNAAVFDSTHYIHKALIGIIQWAHEKLELATSPMASTLIRLPALCGSATTNNRKFVIKRAYSSTHV